MSRRKVKTWKPCEPDQLRNPQQHNCKSCNYFSETDLREFATTLQIPFDDSMDKKQLCRAIRENYDFKQLQSIDLSLNSRRYFVPKVEFNVFPNMDQILSNHLKRTLKQHELKSEQSFYTLDAVTKEIDKQMSFIMDELHRNQMSVVVKTDLGYEYLEDFKEWIKNESAEPDFTSKTYQFPVFSGKIPVGQINVKVERRIPFQSKGGQDWRFTLLDELNKSGLKYFNQIELQGGQSIAQQGPFDSFEQARKILERDLRSLNPYYNFRDGFSRIEDNLINLYTHKQDLILNSTSQWYVVDNRGNTIPFRFRIITQNVENKNFFNQQLQEAQQIFARQQSPPQKQQ
jgi:hypothetical protein